MSSFTTPGHRGQYDLENPLKVSPNVLTKDGSFDSNYYHNYDGSFPDDPPGLGKIRADENNNAPHSHPGKASFDNEAYSASESRHLDLNNNPELSSPSPRDHPSGVMGSGTDKSFHSSHENITDPVHYNTHRLRGLAEGPKEDRFIPTSSPDSLAKDPFPPSQMGRFQNDLESSAEAEIPGTIFSSNGLRRDSITALGQKMMKIIEQSRAKKDAFSVKIDDAAAIAGDMDRLEFKESVLSFKDITYIIRGKSSRFWQKKPPPKLILDHVSGIFAPGVNAIMGPSGGGKTSLLTILGGRKEVVGVKGSILMNGKLISKDFKTESGFVNQEDVLMGTLTVRENIMFSAAVRLSSKIPVVKKKKMVQIIIDELNLGKCADSLVGTEFIRGVSGGEKKRCNIGVELITIPSILFLDEPTSGLDAATANTVVALLKKLSDKGCNIIMSIHQPRFDIFKMFNTLILLSTGKVVYHGMADQALDYFCSQGFECEIHNNPADYFLDVIERNATPNANITTYEDLNGNQVAKIDLAQRYKDSGINDRVYKALNHIEDNRAGEKKRGFFSRKIGSRSGTVYPTTFCTQIKAVAKRTILNLYRSPQSFYVQSFTMIIYSFIVGSIYFQVDSSARYGLQNRSGALFFMIMNQVFGNLSAIELFIRERVLYIHETTNGFYRVSVYFLSKLFCDLVPMRFTPVLLVSIIAYWMIGLQPNFGKYVVFIISLLCLTTSASSIALFASVTFSVIGIATNYCALYFVFMMVFGGLFVNLNSISYGIRWLKYLSIFRYANNALLINEIKDEEYCDAPSVSQNDTVYPKCVYGNNYLEQQGIPYHSHWDLWKNHFALICIILAFWFMSYIQLRRLRKNAKG